MLKFQQRNQCLEFLKRTTQALDLFAQPPIFRILKKNKFTSTLGHIFTLTISALCIVYFIFSMKDLINQTKPSVVFQEQQLIDSNPIYLTKQNFTLAITLTKLSLASLSTYNKDYQLNVQNCYRKRNLDPITGALINVTQICTNYELERCSMEKHFVTTQQKQYFQNINLTYLLCMNSQQWDSRPIVLQGTNLGINLQYITITATTCQNSTNITCNSPDIIQKGLQTGYYGVYISDTLSQFNNPGAPFSPIIQLTYTTFSLTSSKDLFQYFRITQAQTDVGLVLTDIQNTLGLVQQPLAQSQNLYNDLYFVNHNIFLDFKSAVYERTYPKLQLILGSLGGLWQVIYFITHIIIGPIICMMMNLQMANKIFSFIDPQQHQSPLFGSDDFQPSPMLSPRISYQRDLKSSIFKNKTEQQLVVYDSKSLKKFIKKRNGSLNLGFKEMFLVIFGCRKKENKLINYATEKILAKLDVVYIITKLFEIDKIKQLILNEQQLKLFQYLPKPHIPLNLFESQNQDKIKELESIQQFKFILQEEKSDVVKINEAYQSYRLIKYQKENDRINEQLISQLDQDVLQLFQSIDKGNTKLEQVITDQVLDEILNDSDKLKQQDIDENIKVQMPSIIQRQ